MYLFLVENTAHGTRTDEIRAFMQKNPACDGFSVYCKSRSKKWTERIPGNTDLRAVEGEDNNASGLVANAVSGKTPASMTAKESGIKRRIAWELYETAWLLVLLRDTEGRDALRRKRRKVQVAELDAGICRFSPCSDVIARVYNNRDYAPKQPLDGYGRLADVDCSELPPETRTGGRPWSGI